MIRLACPVCHHLLDGVTYGCEWCPQFVARLTDDVPDLVPPFMLLDPRYAFEAGRYEHIAAEGPEKYAGYADTRPEERAVLWAGLLRERGVTEFVDVGPGFGALEASVWDSMDWLAVDLSLGFLTRLRQRWPGQRYVRGLAERLPLETGGVACLVADSIFQSVVDREAFLCQAGRVCAPGGWFIFSVDSGWNYPRRPQGGFDVTRPDEQAVLLRYLKELGFSVEVRGRVEDGYVIMVCHRA